MSIAAFFAAFLMGFGFHAFLRYALGPCATPAPEPPRRTLRLEWGGHTFIVRGRADTPQEDYKEAMCRMVADVFGDAKVRIVE